MLEFLKVKKVGLVLLALIMITSLFAVSAMGSEPANENETQPAIFFQSEQGDLKAWMMEEEVKIDDQIFETVDEGWKVKGVVDANENNHPDLYLYNRDEGKIELWLLDGLQKVSTIQITNPAPDKETIDSVWDMMAVYDLNNSGEPDIIWQRDDGELAVWLMDGQEAYATGRLYNHFEEGIKSVKPDWRIGAVLDLLGDDDAEVIWHAVSGEFEDELAYWKLELEDADAFKRIDSARLINRPPDDPGIKPEWSLRASVDLFGDGAEELLFQRDDGDLAYWTMDELTRDQSGRLEPSSIGTEWTMVGAAPLLLPLELPEYELSVSAERIRLGDEVKVFLKNNTLEDLDFDQLNIRYDQDENWNYNVVPITSEVSAGEKEEIFAYEYPETGEPVLSVSIFDEGVTLIREDFQLLITDELYEAAFTVQDPDEEALEDATVTIKSDYLEETAATDADGVAIFDDLLGDDTYQYKVEKDDYYTEEGTFDIADENVDIEVTLTPYANVTITVEDETGEEIEGATVLLNEREETTDETGKALFEAVEEGDYLVEVSRIGYEDAEKEITVAREDAEFTVVLVDRDNIIIELVDDEIKAGESLTVKIINNSKEVVELDDQADYRFRKWDPEAEEWLAWSSRRDVTVDPVSVAAQSAEEIFDTTDQFDQVGQYQLQVELYQDGSLAFDETLDFAVDFAAVDPGSEVSAESPVTAGQSAEVTVEVVDVKGNAYSGLSEEDFDITLSENVSNNIASVNNDNDVDAEVVEGSFREDLEEPGTYRFEVYSEKAQDLEVTIEVLEVTLDDQPIITFEADTAVKLGVREQPEEGILGEVLDEIVVETQDQFGNFSSKGLPGSVSVIASIETGPEDAALSGVTDKNIGTDNGAGEVTFSDLEVDKLGTYELKFNAAGLEEVVSDEIEVVYDQANPVYLLDDEEAYVDKFDKIEDAINSAGPGYTVLVYPGIFEEDVAVDQEGLTLKAAEGAEATTIKGDSIRILADNITIDGFTVDNEDGERAIGPGSSYGTTIMNNIITNSLRGIQGDWHGRPTNLTITGNTFETDHGVAGTEDSTGLHIAGNTFDTPDEAIGLGVGVEIVDQDGVEVADYIAYLEGANTFINDGGVVDYR